ncbi:hypothetical protein FRB96_007297 [Tulasnella sp. 330]|nr:hypothetical protein FRB96_007297 [Tulasnella sp. 330]
MSSTDDTMVLTAPPTRSTIPLSQADSETFDFDDIQGDVYPSFPKNFEWFFFFTIKNPKAFKADLANFIPKIATAAKTLEALKEISAAKITASNAHESKPTIPLRLYQMALTGKSFYPLGLGATENIRDKYWADGQLVDAYDLGDRPGSESTETKYEPDWDPVWLKHQLHGVILCATHSYGECQLAEIEIKKIFKDSMNIVNIVKGRVRDEPERGHEHFGFNDGISQPAMRGLVNPHPGQLQCDPGVILIGHNGEPNPEASSRAPWTKNSSMMVFRQLKQFVPEFNTFLKKNPTKLEKLTEEQAIALTGAKLFGRFKSGAPIDLVSEIDDPEIGSDPDKNNNFNYQASPLGQTRCPYAAHIRKMAPRFTTNEPLEKVLEQSLIIRAAITYGDELKKVVQ